jgi:hypothetical protein
MQGTAPGALGRASLAGDLLRCAVDGRAGRLIDMPRIDYAIWTANLCDLALIGAIRSVDGSAVLGDPPQGLLAIGLRDALAPLIGGLPRRWAQCYHRDVADLVGARRTAIWDLLDEGSWIRRPAWIRWIPWARQYQDLGPAVAVDASLRSQTLLALIRTATLHRSTLITDAPTDHDDAQDPETARAVREIVSAGAAMYEARAITSQGDPTGSIAPGGVS